LINNRRVAAHTPNVRALKVDAAIRDTFGLSTKVNRRRQRGIAEAARGKHRVRGGGAYSP
jgi:hypothetical protein